MNKNIPSVIFIKRIKSEQTEIFFLALLEDSSLKAAGLFFRNKLQVK